MKYEFKSHTNIPGCTVVYRKGKPIGDATPGADGYNVIHYETDLSWSGVDTFALAFELLRDTDAERRAEKARRLD